jgi:hypothetical protein
MIPPPPVPVAPARTGPGGLPAVTFRWWEAILAFILGNLLLGGLAYAAIAGTSDGGGRVVLGAIALDLVFLGSLVLWLSKAHPGSWTAIGIRATWRALATGAGAGVLLYGVVAFAVGSAVIWILERLSSAPVEAPAQVPDDLSAAGSVGAIVLAVILAPMTEEVFFRGILYRSVRDRAGVVVGVAVSSLLFGAVHLVPADGASVWVLPLVMTVTGAALALLYERSANLVVPVAAHVAFNAIGITLILTGWG